MPADLGTNATVTFANSSFNAFITDISWDGITRPSIDTTYLGTSGGRTFIPGDLYDPGSMTLQIQYDINKAIPYGSTAETITFAPPVAPGYMTAGSWVAVGFVTDVGIQIPLEGMMTGSVTIKFTGTIATTSATT